ncbi:MAG: hypothetical protein OXC25_11275 [Thiotrichales bacterium]|nr:hypothetical protein [Thiotrichales bacterium]
MDFLAQPTGSLRLGEWLNSNLTKDWGEFRAAVAFVKRSGVRHIARRLTEFARAHRAEFIVGVDHQGTSYEGLKGLMDAVSPTGRVVVFHNRLPHTFHPKVYMFKSPECAEIVVGSGNLTAGGLYTNYEGGLRIALDLSNEPHREVLECIDAALDGWSNTDGGTSTDLNTERLEWLAQSGLVLTESQMASSTDESGGAVGAASSGGDGGAFQFEAVPVPAPPSVGHAVLTTAGAQATGRCFVMTLQKTDVGVGQTTAGTSKRSPEIFVPLKARNANPEFWNWPNGFEEDPERDGKFDRRDVRMRVGDTVEPVNMMTWPVKRDFRLRSEALRRLGSIGDLLVMEKVDDADFEYDVEVIEDGTPEYETMQAKCDQTVRNSQKRFGYFWRGF